jgi:hypothetical protein
MNSNPIPFTNSNPEQTIDHMIQLMLFKRKQKLKGLDVSAEYELIKLKKSKLSHLMRKLVVADVESVIPDNKD